MKKPLNSTLLTLASGALLLSVTSGNSTTVLPVMAVTGTVDGLTAGGYMVLNGGVMAVTNATMKNFRAVGGDGSGGGAGLGGAIFVGKGSTLVVNETNFLNNWAIGGNGGATAFGVPIKSGGGLNAGGLGGALLVGAPGLPGLPGTTPVDFPTLMGDGNGNGLDGYVGKAGGDAIGPFFGKGGDGGKGGTGQAGWSTNPKLIDAVTQAELDVASASLNVVVLTAEIAGFGAAAPATMGATAATATALGVSLVDATVQLTKASLGLADANAALAQWTAANAAGTVGVGGDGGMGGSGGMGLFGSSGGVGGDGGAGGLGGGGAPEGNGGAGGRGGVSGFGAGGASGGDGGSGGLRGVEGLPGMGGIAGFGGGAGSTGVGLGMPNATGGGGGSGLGGAIFIQEGANVLITGNTVFSGNGVLAGGSFNRGSAGDSAGSAIFLQGEAKVVLDPGLGNTITFQGRNAIADSSSIKDFAGAQAAQLQGGSVEINSGLVKFSKGTSNSYSGVTLVGGGLIPVLSGIQAARLRADDGDGLPQGSLLQFQNSGVLETSGAFNRYIGSMPGQVKWAGSGGFAAVGDKLTVTLDGGLPLDWGSSNFVPFGSALVLGSVTATHDVTFTNDIKAGFGEMIWVKGVPTFKPLSGVDDNSNKGILSGSISGLGGLTINDPLNTGVIELTNVNTYLGHTTILGGQLRLTGLGSIATSLQVNILNPLASLDLSGSDLPAQSIVGLTGFGKVLLGDKDLLISLPQFAIFDGSIEGSGDVTIGAGSQTFAGVNTYTGKTTVGPLANLSLVGDGSISASSGLDVTGIGRFDIAFTSAGASIKSLEGSGFVELGSKPLTITDALGTYSGVMSGTGALNITSGTQTMSGVNTFSGKTTIASGATLALSGAGEISNSSEVAAEGTFSIAAAADGASIRTLSGAGIVTLGDKTLTVTNGSTAFAGAIGGEGALTISGGKQSLSGVNGFTGKTTVAGGATLEMLGAGSISASSELHNNGLFDISGAANSSIVKLTGAGVVSLGSNTLTVTSAGNGVFSGSINGAGGFTVSSGIQTLSGVNGYTGATQVASGASLFLSGAGSIAPSAEVSVATSGVFDISNTTSGAAIKTLSGAGSVGLGSRDLTVTAGSTTFTGALGGTGDAIVSGGTQTFSGSTITSGLVAKDTGAIVLTGGSVTPPGSKPALGLVNGGTITATGATITSQNGPTIAAQFDTAGRVSNITLGAGTTVLPNNGELLVVTRTGAGGDGVVNLVINNGQANTGSILDPNAQGGGVTNVAVRPGSGYSGLVDVGNFDVAAGATVTFADKSRISGNLTAEQGANLFGGTVDGPLQVSGNVSINNGVATGSAYLRGNFNLDGFFSPGASPGAYAVAGNYTAQPGATSKFEVTYGLLNPQASVHYDQLSIGGDVSGVTPIDLQSWNSTRATPLGDLSKIELVRIGGAVNGEFTQAHRVTQHGHEILLDRRRRAIDPNAPVTMSDRNEEQFFGQGPITVYGLRSIIQDETYALGVLASTANQANRDMLGTLSERRGFGDLSGAERAWARMGSSRTTVNDVVWRTQNLSFVQGGLDLIKTDGLRVGVLGGYGSSEGRVLTETGKNKQGGELWAGGVYATYMNGGAYIDGVAQYGGHSWSFTPTAASGMQIDGRTMTVAVEAGYTMKFDYLSLTPWVRATYMATSFEQPRTAWIDNATLHRNNSAPIQVGLKSDIGVGRVTGHLGMSVTHDPNAQKHVVVDGFRYDTDSAGTRAEGTASMKAKVSDGISVFGAATAAYGIGSEMRAFGGRLGMRVDW